MMKTLDRQEANIKKRRCDTSCDQFCNSFTNRKSLSENHFVSKSSVTVELNNVTSQDCVININQSEEYQ